MYVHFHRTVCQLHVMDNVKVIVSFKCQYQLVPDITSLLLGFIATHNVLPRQHQAKLAIPRGVLDLSGLYDPIKCLKLQPA